MSELAYVQLVNGNSYELEVYIDPINKRIRIDDYRGNVKAVVSKAEEIISFLKKEKLIFIARKEHFPILLQHGFQCEALVEGYFRGSDAYYFSKYYHDDRRQSKNWLMEDKILHAVKNTSESEIKIPSHYQLLGMEKNDAKHLSQLYQKVFKIYPTPLHDPEYIKKTMDEGTRYYGFLCDGELVSCASTEKNLLYHHAELTDCATLPQHRKYGLMKRIIQKLETDLRQQGIYCAFSIARAQSFGMNAVLHRLGYQYRGRLMNNCYIFDKLENMNMWVKDLSKDN
ncbi:putative beta-lysine N-acetyltransferase [Niallia sp. XMNu-256]|uniref:putative beta-lysine N-acetyltransferase n=1 Tax=Niallia sp. XMNu-256 TaxID=3082444 RepID=UPI0030CABAB8